MKDIKNVLLFTRSNINHNSLNIWITEIEEQLNKRGITTHSVSMLNDEEKIVSDLSIILSNHKIDLALAVNAIGQQNWMAAGSKMSLWDSLNIPFVNWIVDHPLEHSSDLESTTRGYSIICIDQKHKKFIDYYFPNIRQTFFLPLGGLGDESSFSEDFDSFKGRKYDIVLTAGLMEPDEIKKQLLNLPADFRDIAIKWTDYMENNLSYSPEEALKLSLKDKFAGLEPPKQLYFYLAKICSPAITYIRTWIRKAVVRNLMDSGVPFHIFGNGWDELNASSTNSNAILHGDIPITETINIMKDTKLSLNIMPMFKAGTHDRISTAQLNGAAVLTDSNDYINQLYSKNEIYKYSLENYQSLPTPLQTIQENTNFLYEVAINGQKKAQEKLSWDKIGNQLINILETVANNQ